MVELLNREYGFVYAIKSLDLIKVGVSTDIEQRLDAMRALNPHGCELVFYRRSYAPYTFEKRMHELLADKALGREWFRVSLADVRAAANVARLASIRAERAIKAQERAARNSGKLARCVRFTDTSTRGIKWLQANIHPI